MTDVPEWTGARARQTSKYARGGIRGRCATGQAHGTPHSNDGDERMLILILFNQSTE